MLLLLSVFVCVLEALEGRLSKSRNPNPPSLKLLFPGLNGEI
jgi:hypothetical protein